MTTVASVVRRPEFVEFEGAGGSLGALRWEGHEGAWTVLAVHGITANAWHFDPLAHRLSGDAHVIALDLRGRGRSYAHPGPFGIRQHVADLAAVIRQIDGRVLVIGHSMGCYVALMVAQQHPELVDELLLVDGGTALPVPADTDTDESLDALLGPAIARLRKVWPDRVSYNTMWAQHPAFDGALTIDLERNLLADLIEVDGGFRTAVNENAVRLDGRELLADEEVRTLLALRQDETTIVRAPAGLNGEPPPLIGDDVIASLPQHRWLDSPETNHYTVLLGARGADLVADVVRSKLAIA